MSRSIRIIVVGSGTLRGPDPAVAAAADLARRSGARLHVVHAFDLPSPIQAAYARELFLDAGVLGRYGDEVRAGMETRLRAAVRGCDAVFHAVEGEPAERIAGLALELEAELVVVGASRGSRIWRQLLGSTAEGVVRRARAPVLVARRPVADPVQRVLFTTDLTEASAGFQRGAARLVRALGGDAAPVMRCVMAVQSDTMPFDFRADVVLRLAERELRAFLDRSADDGACVEARVRLGGAAEEILAEAAEWQPDLLVLGAHGERGGYRQLLGRVAGAALRGTTANVLVMPCAPVAAPAARREGALAAAG
jgi:nucleotide-binding universal stress UspA family protein